MSWGQAGARQAYHTGRGSIVMRAKAMVEENRGERRSIVLTEIPYQVGKSGLVEKIAEAVKDKRIEGVSDIRDESNQIGRASCRERVCHTCRSRWSTYHSKKKPHRHYTSQTHLNVTHKTATLRR